MTTRVVNIRDLPRDLTEWPDDHVYIGRAVSRRRLRASPLSNPFSINNVGGREAAIARFEHYLWGRPDLLAMIPALRGKTLVCWCAPEACHGDVLARLADET